MAGRKRINLTDNLKDKYNSFSFNSQINIMIGLIILATIILITTSIYMQTLTHIKQTYKETGLLILQETTDKIIARLKQVENTTQMISNDSRILNFTDSSKNVSESEVTKYLNNCFDFNKYDVHHEGLAYVQNFIDDIIFITDKNIIIARRLHFSAYNFREQLDNEWLKRATQSKDKHIWTDHFYNGAAEKIFNSSKEELTSQLNQFMIIRSVESKQAREDSRFIIASVSLENMSRLIDNIRFGRSGSLYIIDENGNILASKDRSMLLKRINFNNKTINSILSNNSSEKFFEDKINSEDYFIFSSPLSINNWKLAITIPVKEFKDSISGTLFSVVFIGVLSFFIITIISSLVFNNLSNPLKKILALIKEAHNGDLSQRVSVKGCMEVNELSTEFNFMFDKINNLMELNVNEQKALRKSELKALRAQINPHFLYNTLDSIKWLIFSGDNDKASKLITSLTTFFRIGLSGGNEEITICNEVEHIRQYLFIQKLRRNDNMDYIIDIDSEIEYLKTPKLVLQPIIENAVFHGLDKKSGFGIIKVIARKKDENSVLFEISDNGIGINAEELENLNQKMNDIMIQNASDTHGYALINVNQRVKLCYGEEYGISIESKYNFGTRVSFTIPVIMTC